MAAVSLRNVRKVYGRGPAAYVAVHDLDLDVADGEFVVLVGPSGCGKSTVLRMIAGLEDITDGAMHIGERRVNDVAPGARDIAMVFQTYALYPHMTVYDNLAFALRLARRDREAVDRRVRAAASAMHIVPLLPRFPRQLSGGERQRVALGRALVREPQVFLFDEPLSNLDARLRVEMRREIARLHRDLGTTMLYVTHDQVEAMTLGDRIVVLRAGRVQQVDTPSALYAAPASVFVARFIGSPGMNIVQGTVQGAGPTRHIANDHSLRVPLPTAWSATLAARGDASVLIGIRPEHILWREAGDDAPTTEPPHLIVRVEHVEHLGNEFVVHGHADVTELAVRASADRRAPVVGALLALWFDLDQVHCFDPVTEMRLPQ